MSIRIQSLSVYPVKSCRGIRVQQSRVEPRGLEWDRRWMLVDSQGVFLSQRRQTKLALVSTGLGANCFTLSAPDMSEFSLPRAITSGVKRLASVWDSNVEVLEHPDASRWFTAAIGEPCHAVYLPDERRRLITSSYAEAGDHVSFADAFPCLLLSQASLDELNRRCPEPMLAERFRPNIVVSGGSAHFEDELSRFQLGEVSFRAPKLCDRCKVTLVDPDTALSGKEPLRTLASYRRWDNKVWFGVNLVPDTTGTLRIGDVLRELPKQPCSG